MLSLKDLKKLDRDDLLDLVGLQRASSNDWVAPALTALGVGLLVGAGIGLLLAPKPGAELRNDLKDRLRSAQDTLPDQLRGATASGTPGSSRSSIP
ncbi:MAG TPA: YtxH domain-containing protein [Myxococcaceae bacterium]|nr:YtxH domain-containing protein [Myxococcaceae bacterium]